MSERPEIEIEYHYPKTYSAKCPLDNCKWEDHSTLHSELEEQVYAHEQWHEDGMPQ